MGWSPLTLVALVNARSLDADDFVEAVALRVVEMLETRTRRTRFVTASELARELSIDRDWVYAHAAELGAVRLGEGPRGRLRFDLDRAADALARRASGTSTPVPSAKRRGRPRKTPLPPDVQPLRGRKERG